MRQALIGITGNAMMMCMMMRVRGSSPGMAGA